VANVSSSTFVELDGRMYRDDVVRIGRGARKIRYEIYVRPNGGLFALPIDDADAQPGDSSHTLVSRTVIGNRGPVNTYIAKGFRYATKADLERYREKNKENEARAVEARKMSDPVEKAKTIAKIQAVANAEALAAMGVRPQGGGRRDG
jgi:hypothetical protein